jgi:hypothetical protein
MISLYRQTSDVREEVSFLKVLKSFSIFAEEDEIYWHSQKKH